MQRRHDQQRGEKEDGLARKPITAGAHRRRGNAVADRCEARIAADSFAETGMAGESKADRRDGRAEDATRSRMQRAGAEHDGEDRPRRNGERAHADRRHRKACRQSRRAHRIDQRAPWHLTRQGHQPARGEDEADIDLSPRLRGQIDCDKGTKAGLDIGQEKAEPVEAAEARAWRLGARPRRRPRGGSRSDATVNSAVLQCCGGEPW